MGILPPDIDILPPSDDRVFKLLMTSPETKAGLMKLISAIIGRNVVDVWFCTRTSRRQEIENLPS